MSTENTNGNGERFDDHFRESLGNFTIEPSPRVWTRLSRKLLFKELIRFNFKNVPWYTWLIIGSTAVMVGTGAYLLMKTDEQAGTVSHANITADIHKSVPAALSNQKEITDSRHSSSAATTQTALRKQGQGADSPNLSPVITRSVTPPPPATHRGGVATRHMAPASTGGGSDSLYPSSALTSSPVILAQVTSSRPAGESIALMTGYSAPPFSLLDPPRYVKLKHVDNPRPPQDEVKTTARAWKTKPESSLGIGLDIAPQIVFYKVPSNYFKYNYTFDLGVQYNIRRFYVQAAAGFTWSSDVGNFAVYYTKRDSIGYIYSVGSFAPDPLHPGEVVYNTKMETVYDSNNYVYDYNTQNTYYYLQFPLILGFKAVKTPKWSLGIEAGALYMLMVKKDEPEPVFYIPDTRVNEIVRQDPLKKVNSFGITAGARLEYEFSEGFFLVVEPTFNYYLNQVDESGSVHATQPYSIGLRAGLWYRIVLNSQK